MKLSTILRHLLTTIRRLSTTILIVKLRYRKKNFNQFKKSYIDIEFELDNEFIYYSTNDRRRLCISTFCEVEIFRMNYDDN